MEFNRNQYFFLGIVILLVGLQFRSVSEYVLTEDATRFLAERLNSASDNTWFNFSADVGVAPKKVLRPPEWLGWCAISVGAVLILHSLAMRKPGS